MDKIERGYTQEPHVHVSPETRHLDAPLLQLDLPREVDDLRRSRGASDHAAKTLAKYDDLRVVLIALKQGGRLAPHQAQGRVSLQILEGRVEVGVAEQRVALGSGGLLAIAPSVSHEVTALDESALLLTMPWGVGAPERPR